MKLNRDALDQWFPIYLRYLGSFLGAALVAAVAPESKIGGLCRPAV